MHKVRNTPTMEATIKYNNFLMRKKERDGKEKVQAVRVVEPFKSLERVQ